MPIVNNVRRGCRLGLLLLAIVAGLAGYRPTAADAVGGVPVVTNTAPAAVVRPSSPPPATPAPATPAPPPSSDAKRSPADLEKLAQPIALHPDPLIAVLLPASVYPVEIVQAARFVKDTNNIPKVDAQPWDDNVKAVARFPALIAQMDANLDWTVNLGQASNSAHEPRNGIVD
jgi:hypothetical protein